MEDYKEKYEKALEYMRTIYPTLNGADKEDVEHNFPELKESKDERIRKMFRGWIYTRHSSFFDNGISKEEIITWLEKQKDHDDELEKAYKTADEVQYRKGFEDGVASVKTAELNEDDENVRIKLIKALKECGFTHFNEEFTVQEALDWLEKQGEKTNPYSGISFEYNGNVWGMCARDNGVDILLDKQLFKHLENQGEQETICDKCRKEHSSHSCQDITELGRCAVKHEKKLDDKVEPKFKVGDWVRSISSGNIFKILSVNDGLYRVLCYDGVEANYPIEVEKDLAYWTIQDAKDGDVLAAKDIVFMFKHMDKTGLSLCKSYCEVIGNSKLGLGFDFSINSVHPATEEQYNLLFQKMHEAGYEWDAEKKELKKIEQKHIEWSEEDERNINEALSYIKDEALKTFIKNKIGCEMNCTTTKEWSEEDEDIRDTIVRDLKRLGGDIVNVKPAFKEEIDWLKSLEQRLKGSNQ